ncbi:hypothetical protein B808_1242 [Fructilactobacillus florum 8D]|uniref:Uncharacterized protein n=2 Tax=Fructilactobacillus florum TaxID=640331 RepID=W9EF99_9LACO|nr:YtxH domain-containing protein [Fructilactobacillus florum]EKK20928.1 hypothetical protein B807_338 [Fructilactobacillus florum 2F]ETO39911.1 hypothetical protein B808_1242 [Fructilactobacillus florum 8D]KRM92403.1 hypothetical protein FC87_GL000015 [Fructilactobacillus florum DSM 22689 = JCM 16035]
MKIKTGLLMGGLLTSTAAYLAFRMLDEEKQRKLKIDALETVEDAKDRAVDYALYAADTLADTRDSLTETMGNYKDSLNVTSQKVNDKLNDLKDDLSQLQAYLRVRTTDDSGQPETDENDDITVKIDDQFTNDAKGINTLDDHGDQTEE